MPGRVRAIPGPERLRLGEILAALSLVTDLARGDLLDAADLREGLAFMFGLGEGLSPARRATTVAAAIARGPAGAKAAMRADCEVATQMARAVGPQPERGDGPRSDLRTLGR